VSSSILDAPFDSTAHDRRKSLGSMCSNTLRSLRRHLFSSRTVTAYWLINLVSLAALLGWAFNDGRFGETARRFDLGLLTVLGRVTELGPEPQLAARVFALNLLSGFATASVLGIILGLFLGGAAHRRLRNWLFVTALVAAWLTLLATWPNLIWRGQAHRMRSQVSALQSTVATLTKEWPTCDGTHPAVGPFLAYPLEHPRVLLLLTQANAEGSNLSFSTVEQSDEGALRFQLAGNEAGSWLEWHPAHNEPRGFIGGLLQQFTLDRFTKLAENWYLVRYK
jgi:hypothetical protein